MTKPNQEPGTESEKFEKAGSNPADSKTEEPVQYGNLMDTIFKEYEKNGGMEYLAGKGKPLKNLDGDPLNGVLAEAGYKPAWLELQHKIRDQLIQLIERMNTLDERTLQVEVDQINEQIKKLNRDVPSPHLQKTRIFPDMIEKQLKHWL